VGEIVDIISFYFFFTISFRLYPDVIFPYGNQKAIKKTRYNRLGYYDLGSNPSLCGPYPMG
jgi:hypothetical protein